MHEKEFTWRGLRFEWNGRRRIWLCERPSHQSQSWWVTHQFYERSHYLTRLDKIDWDSPPPEDHPELQIFASMGYVAHLGHGDAAVRPTRLDALEGALEYALRFHHQSLAELRKVCFAPTGELCRAIAGGGPTATPLYCEHLKNHEGGHSWEIRQ